MGDVTIIGAGTKVSVTLLKVNRINTEKIYK